MKRSEMNEHYWDGKGVYSKELKTLTDEMMPASGRGKNLVAEVVRAVNRIYYEYCNNGNINAIIVSSVWDEEEEYEEITGFSPYYAQFFKIIERGIVESENPNFTDKLKDEVKKAVEDIKDFILTTTLTSAHSWYFNDENMNRYDRLVDLVTFWALEMKGDETPIPEWYENDKM